MLSSRTFDIDAALAPARRALGLARCARWALHGLICAAVVSVVVLMLARVWPIPDAPPLAGVILILGPLVGGAGALSRWPTPLEAARATDRCFLLGDRMTTALEFRYSDETFPVLQRADLAHSVRGLPLHRVSRGRPRWRERGCAAAALALVGVLALEGSAKSTAATAETPAYIQQSIQHVGAVSLSALGRNVTATNRRDPSIARLRAELDRLRRQFQHPTSLGQALRAISVTQQRLSRLDAELRPLGTPASAELNHALDRVVPPGGTPPAASGDGTARALSRLVGSLRRLDAAQRQAVARALNRAASTTSNSRLKNALRQAATALAGTHPASATVFLKTGVTLLNNAAQAQHTRALIHASTSRLDRLKNALSAVQRKSLLRPTPTAAGKSGASNQGNGKQAGKSASARQKKPSASRLAGQSWKPTNERNAAKGQRVITNIRRAGQGGRVNDDPQNSIQKGRKARSTVYVHGHEGNGTRLVQNGSRAAPGQVRQQQYQQLVVRYARSARSALDHGALPPSVQSYVRQYFSEISQ